MIEMMFCPLVSFFSFKVDSKCSLTPLLSKTEREREREREGDRGRLTPTCNKDSLNTGNILEKSTFYLLSKRLYHLWLLSYWQ